jgi:hypothetical protein
MGAGIELKIIDYLIAGGFSAESVAMIFLAYQLFGIKKTLGDAVTKFTATSSDHDKRITVLEVKHGESRTKG